MPTAVAVIQLSQGHEDQLIESAREAAEILDQRVSEYQKVVDTHRGILKVFQDQRHDALMRLGRYRRGDFS